MQARVIAIAAVLLLVAAVLLFRGGSPDGDEVGGARRGGPSSAERGGERPAGADRGAPLAVKPASRGDVGAERPGAGRGADESRDAKGEALVIPGASRGGGQVVGGGGAGEGAAGGQVLPPGARPAADRPGSLDAGGDHPLSGNPGEAQNPGGVDADGAPALPGVVFTSDEDKQYATTEPVDLPDSEDFSRDAGSVNFWLEPGWEGDNQDDADFIDLGDGGLRVVKNVNFLRFEYIDANGVESGVGVEITDWKPGEARQVTATWDGSTINLYVDGKLVSQRPNPGLQRSDEKGPVIVGSAYPPDRPIAPGVMSQVQLFNRPLDPSEINSILRKKK